MASSISNEHVDNLNLDFRKSSSLHTGESGDSSIHLVQQSNHNVDDISNQEFELTLNHVNGESIFWDGGYRLKSQIMFKGNKAAFPLSIETVIGKYLADDYFRTEQPNDDIVLIKGNFKPISLDDSFGSLFQDGEAKSTIFVRSRDFSLNDVTTKKSQISRHSDMNTNVIHSEENDVVVVSVEEVSGRRILWDGTNQNFDYNVQLQVPRATLETTKVDSLLSRILASNYFLDTNNAVLDKQIWTDKIKVVGLKDTLDVLCRSSNKIKIYLKYIRNSEDQQWQEILDAISQFRDKVNSTDEDLRMYYEDNRVFDDMEELKRQIQRDHRNEEDIQEMMLKLEPKLNLALSLISTIEQADRDDSLSTTESDYGQLRCTESQRSQSCRYEESSVSYQFYHW